MSFLDNMKDTGKKRLEEAKKSQEKYTANKVQKQQANAQKQNDENTNLAARGVKLQLRSLEGTTTFYETHIEIKSLLGGKVVNLPYNDILSVSMAKTNKLAKGTAAAMTMGMSLAVTNHKVLLLTTVKGRRKLDFRREPAERIELALNIISSKVAGKYNPTMNVNLSQAAPHPTISSGADDLVKFAKLRDQKIITEEEFQAKKKQILGI